MGVGSGVLQSHSIGGLEVLQSWGGGGQGCCKVIGWGGFRGGAKLLDGGGGGSGVLQSHRMGVFQRCCKVIGWGWSSGVLQSHRIGGGGVFRGVAVIGWDGEGAGLQRCLMSETTVKVMGGGEGGCFLLSSEMLQSHEMSSEDECLYPGVQHTRWAVSSFYGGGGLYMLTPSQMHRATAGWRGMWVLTYPQECWVRWAVPVNMPKVWKT